MVLQPDDDSKTGTLPDPELNPLLNPLLAANMGRWAEVYFTNPPEKRGQAVAELLRELERNPQPEHHSDAVPQNIGNLREKNAAEDVLLRRSFEGTEAAATTCPDCGHGNDTTQRFCGMCGMPLPMNEGASPRLGDPAVSRQRSWHDQNSSETEHQDDEDHDQDKEKASFGNGSPAPYARLDLPSFASLPDDAAPDDAGGLFHYESQPAGHHFRIYVGLGLAIILGLLVYKTWRGNASFWASHTAPAALPQEAPSNPPSTPAPNPAPTEPSAAQQNTGTTAANPPETTPAKQNEATPKPAPSKSELNRAPQATAAIPSPANAAAQSGAAELAVGEKYLNGGAGAARDSAEAASWLWKAVAKKNPTATLLLSDLYLHGDGVPKSCDQARLLLDAAARKGNAAAAERLRNLPAFGCQ